MKRIAAPMIGGIITSAGFLNLLVYPVIYVMWRQRPFAKAPRGRETRPSMSNTQGDDWPPSRKPCLGKVLQFPDHRL